MKKADIQVGKYYRARVSDKIVTVRVDRIEDRPAYKTYAKGGTHYKCTNLSTGRKVTFRSAARFRKEVPAPTAKSPEGQQYPDPTTAGLKRRGATTTSVGESALTNPSSNPCADLPPPRELPAYLGGKATGREILRQKYLRTDEDGQEETTDQCINRIVTSANSIIPPPIPDTPPPLPAEYLAQYSSGVQDITEQDATISESPRIASVTTKGEGGGLGIKGDQNAVVSATEPGTGGGKPLSGLAQRLRAKRGAKPAQSTGETPTPSEPMNTKGVNDLPATTHSCPHIEVSALAGTGKTTSVVGGVAQMKGVSLPITPSEQQAALWEMMKVGKSDRVRISAYNKTITDELERRVKVLGLDKMGVEAKGVHSLGYAAVRKAFGYLPPNDSTDMDRLAEVMGGAGTDYRQLKSLPGMWSVMSLVAGKNGLVSLCKQTLTDPTPENIDKLMSHFDKDAPTGGMNQVYDLVPRVLEASLSPKDSISFDDMIWLPLRHDLPIYKTDVQIIDESQDLNRMQQELVYRSGDRIVFVGDKHQAIYGFAGADSESMERMERTLAAQPRGLNILPLTVTRRCSHAVVGEARSLVPEFSAHPDNLPGAILEALFPTESEGSNNYWMGGGGLGGRRRERKWEETYGPMVQYGDMVICRCNGPVVSECFRLLKRGIKANILGRSIGEGLISMVEKSERTTKLDFLVWLQNWLDKELASENAKKFPSENRIINLNDKFACLASFCDGCDDTNQITQKIRSVFTDTPGEGVRLSSIHKSKGLEARQVFLLEPEGATVPHPMARTAWQRVQEYNLRYVAQTRAIENLIYVS